MQFPKISSRILRKYQFLLRRNLGDYAMGNLLMPGDESDTVWISMMVWPRQEHHLASLPVSLSRRALAALRRLPLSELHWQDSDSDSDDSDSLNISRAPRARWVVCRATSGAPGWAAHEGTPGDIQAVTDPWR